MNYRKSDIPEDLLSFFVRAEIGLEQTPAEFVEQIVGVMRECRRVLRDDGTVFLNLGDSYFSSSASGSGPQGKTGLRADRRFTAEGAGARRAAACGTSGIEPEGSQQRDCLCGSLCDACRRAYRCGRFRSDASRAPMPAASQSASSRERMESESARLPTSDLMRRVDRTEGAIPLFAQGQDRALEQHHASLASMPLESASPLPASFHQSGQPSECLSCGCSLQHSVPASDRMAGCMCDTSAHESESSTLGRDVSGSAYPHLTTGTLKPKDLIGIPWRVAFALQADGWWLRQDIIWAKPNPMPESVTDRCTKAHEYLFLLSKSATYHCDMAAIAEPMVSDGGGGFYSNDSAYRIETQAGGASSGERKRDGGRNKRSVWTVATQPYSEAHFATFPPALIEPCIKAGCPVGGTVLDPFGGAGTTGLVADGLQRSAILIELNPTYAEIARARITNDAPLFADVVAEAPEPNIPVVPA